MLGSPCRDDNAADGRASEGPCQGHACGACAMPRGYLLKDIDDAVARFLVKGNKLTASSKRLPVGAGLVRLYFPERNPPANGLHRSGLEISTIIENHDVLADARFSGFRDGCIHHFLC
jgi:hypothetical protein